MYVQCTSTAITTQLFGSFVIDSIPLPAQVLPHPHVQVQLPLLQAKIMDSFPFWTFWQVSEPCLCLSQGTDPNNEQSRNYCLKFT